MPLHRAVPVMLTTAERTGLKKRARGAKAAYPDWLRAQIVLAAARGLDGLKDLPRSGRPRRISALERAAVCALACQLPAATGVPKARWSGPELAAGLVAQSGLVSSISPSSVLRILAEHPIKPWQYQS